MYYVWGVTHHVWLCIMYEVSRIMYHIWCSARSMTSFDDLPTVRRGDARCNMYDYILCMRCHASCNIYSVSQGPWLHSTICLRDAKVMHDVPCVIMYYILGVMDYYVLCIRSHITCIIYNVLLFHVWRRIYPRGNNEGSNERFSANLNLYQVSLDLYSRFFVRTNLVQFLISKYQNNDNNDNLSYSVPVGSSHEDSDLSQIFLYGIHETMIQNTSYMKQ